MRSKIAVATLSGKPYYLLVSELKERAISFISCIPGNPIPPSVEVVITTEREKPLIDHRSVLVYESFSDPSDTVDQALLLSERKETYGEITIGVDPGKTFGVAVLGDGKVLKKELNLTLEEAIVLILNELEKRPSQSWSIKIGNGVPLLAKEMSGRLRKALPAKTRIEFVSEEGTSSSRMKGNYKKVDDSVSAINIARKTVIEENIET